LQAFSGAIFGTVCSTSYTTKRDIPAGEDWLFSGVARLDAMLLSVAEFEFDSDNRVLSRDDIKRMSAELLMANQRRGMSSAATNQKISRRRRKKTFD